MIIFSFKCFTARLTNLVILFSFENFGKYIIDSITDEILDHYKSVIIYQIIIFSI